MISLDFTNIFHIGSTHGLTKEEYEKTMKRLPACLKDVQSRGQGFYSILDDAKEVKHILAWAKKQKGKFDSIVVLGIGGSALGALCLEQALLPLLYKEGKKKIPKLYVLDNVDPDLIREVDASLDYSRTLFLVISKSGGTVETLSQFFYFKKKALQKKLDLKKHFVIVTDKAKGFLREVAEREGFDSFAVPDNVGGRFSVFTSVGLLPAALLGLDVQGLLKGARAMRDLFFSEDSKGNLPFQLAAIQFLLAQKGKNIHVVMPYLQHLTRFRDWYIQLLAESIGKAIDREGETVNVGITPTSALGVTDQHAQTQLFNEGPYDKLVLFLDAKERGKNLPIPNSYPKKSSISFPKGATFQTLIAIEMEATREAYTQNKRPNLTLTLDKIDALNLGQLLFLCQGSVAFLGELYGVNAFDQPGVELAKKIIAKQLSKQ